MKKFLLIYLTICLLFWAVPKDSKADGLAEAKVPEACRHILTAQKVEKCEDITNAQERQKCLNCVTCERVQQGTWLKIPLPIIFNPTIKVPYGVGEDTLKNITYSGRCIHNPAIFFFMLYYLGLVLLAVIAVFTLMFGGYLYLISFGNTEKLGQAKATMFSAIIGLIVGLLSYLMVDFLNPDLTSFHWGTERLSQELEQAMKRIEKKAEEEEKDCLNVPGTSLECKGKKIKDICSLSPGGKGYCEEDANIQGCVCVANKCVNNCDQGKPACVGEKCLFPSGDYGQCVADAVGTVTCRDLNSVCGAGDCGGSAASSWEGLNCFGEYECATSGGKQGFCLNTDPGTGDYGTSLCKSFEELCEGDCGRAFSEYYQDDKLPVKCHASYLCEAKTGVCFTGTCRDLATDDLGILGCNFDKPALTCNLACESGGKYGLCNRDGYCEMSIGYGKWVDCGIPEPPLI